MEQRRVAVVTGANRGIGLEVVRQLAARGYSVVLVGRDRTKADAAALSLGEACGLVHPCEIDVADDASVRRGCAAIAKRFRVVHVLVNNAASQYDPEAAPSTVDIRSVSAAFETNTLGAWRMIQALLPVIPRDGTGRIVNVSSRAGSFGYLRGKMPAYTVSKTALNALTRHFAAELAPFGILVNAVDPAATITGMSPTMGRAPAESAASVVWAVELPVGGPSGCFFRDGHPIPW